MYAADISITTFKIIGVFPSENLEGFLTIYNLYTVLVALIIVAFTTTNIFYILTEKFEHDEFLDNLFYNFAVITSTVKMVSVYRKRKKIREIWKCLQDKQFEPRDSVEFSIQSKFDKIGRFLFYNLLCLCFIAFSRY